MFKIKIDTREKVGMWGWDDYETEICTIKTGDYTIESLEDKLVLERKKTVSELAGNVTKPRFLAEIKRMEEYAHRFLILEFSVDDLMMFPVGSDIPKRKWNDIRIRGPYILSFLTNIQLYSGVNVIFAGDKDNAEMIALNIMQKVYAKYSTN